ncbi:substrate-binding domain-containing protein [Nocardioides sp.]|uniref:substrate-binding domain-containing protein n=1 Tax=Nocardioides sp. TaxID=35761 RepID=UPI002C482B18|nr:VWA domain-containing protein [Nocardioides sp.]HXH77097.1 VWA domain-containing protein [Nocardioides sp.]
MFGAHNTHTSDTVDRESATSTSRPYRLAIAGLVLALLAAAAWVALLGSGDDDTAAVDADCKVTLVTVAVAPAMTDLVDDAVEALPDNGQCIELQVITKTVADVSAEQEELDEGDEDVLPDLWVPDSPAWQSVLTDAGRTGKVLVASLATTPVAFASGRADDPPASWLEALASPRLVMSDPKASGASALALLSPFVEGDVAAAQGELVPVAQAFGDDVASEKVGKLNIDNLEAGNDKLLPVTEQDFLVAERGNSALEWVAPDTGVGLLSYPLIQPSAGGSGMAVNSGSLDVAGRTGARLAEWFTTDAGLAAIAAEKLRAPDGAPLPDGEGISDEEQLPPVDKAQVDSVMKSWNSLIVPSSILALVETSDSMGTAFGDTTRIQLAVDASLTALDIFPDAVRLGLRSFSTNQESNGQDWRELAPLSRLDAPLGKGQGIHVELVRKRADELPSQTGGGSGLYDSILAAYQETNRLYNEYYENSLVVFSDGPNDDPEGISLNELKRELRQLYDPEKPVKIILIGIADEADLAALEEIAAAPEGSGSGAYQVLKADDMLTVLASTLLSRD